jgi:carbon storage regulator CsrA
MLVLTRKYQEKIRIGDNITITVLRTKGKAVRLGIEAPADVPVIRGELSFESAADEARESEVDGAVAGPVTSKRSTSRYDSAPVWAADPPCQSKARSRESQRPEVTLSRVSRTEVSEYLPKLVSGAGPLRAMMDQR